MKDWKEVWPERVSPSGQMKKSLSQEEKTEVWVYKAKALHGDLYDYSKSEYSTNHGKILITCQTHGDFYQTASGHLRGNRCPNCFGSKRKTTEEFVKEAVEVHGDLYDYSLAEYLSAHEKLEIVCETHGSFWQSPRNHTHGGNGCPHCFNRESSDTVYLLDYGQSMYKIGITNNIGVRISQLSRSFGKSVLLVKQAKSTQVKQLEQVLLNKYTVKPSLVKKFNGYTELRVLTEEEVEEICSFLGSI